MKHVIAALLSVVGVIGLLMMIFAALPAAGQDQPEILNTVTVPGVTVKVPGPTSTITVKVPGPAVPGPVVTQFIPGPTVTQLVPGATVTRFIPQAGATKTISVPQATETVMIRPDGSTVTKTPVPLRATPTETPITEQFSPPTRQEAPSSGRVVTERPDGLLPDSAVEVVGISLLSAFLIAATSVGGVLYGYRMGRRKRDEEERNFIERILNDTHK